MLCPETYQCNDICTVLLITPAQVFSSEFYKIFQNTYSVCDYCMLHKKGVLKTDKIHGKIHVNGCFWY